MTCESYGWGTGAWGQMPWGSSGSAPLSGQLPTTDPFDIYCVGPCDQMINLLDYIGVDVLGEPSHIGPATDSSIEFIGGVDPLPAWIFVNTQVTSSNTWEFTARVDALPTNFSNPAVEYVFFGLTNQEGSSIGLFFSDVGIGYLGYFEVDAYGNLTLQANINNIPDSYGIITAGEYYVIRAVTDGVMGRLYLYITKAEELTTTGHVLRFVLPLFPSSEAATTPPDRTWVGCSSTQGKIVDFRLGTLCLSSTALVANVPPTARAGADQATVTCSIVRLDGSSSFDPEGNPISYRWRLVGAPDTSETVFTGYDGVTYQITPHAPPAQYTNKFYSEELAGHDAVQPVGVGDVLVIAGVPHDIVSKGLDGNGWYVEVDGYELQDDLSQTSFHLYHQHYISNRTEARPTFYPDVPGIFRFSLTVFDGQLYSAPSTCLVNVLESQVARGCVPDMSFVWNYLSDALSFVSDLKPRMETVFSAMAQLVSAELLRLWQIDASKSLRDIPRVFTRKWLSYDPSFPEVTPEATSHRLFQSGCLTPPLPDAGTAVPDGATIVFDSPLLRVPMTCRLTGSDFFSAYDLQYQLQKFFTATDPRFSAQIVILRGNPASTCVRITAPVPFAVTADSTLTTAILPPGEYNTMMDGGSCTRLSETICKLDTSFQGLSPGDYQSVILDGVAYTIDRFVDDPSDLYPYQRVVVKQTLHAFVQGVWSIPDQTISLRSDYYEGCVSDGDVAEYEILPFDGSDAYTVYCPVVGASEYDPTILLVDLRTIASEVLLQTIRYRVLLKRVIRRVYVPIDQDVVDIPTLQPSIVMTDDTQVLRRNIDFFVDVFRGFPVVRFVSSINGPDVWEGELPPEHLWAEYTYLDNRLTIENNFGRAVGVYAEDIAALPSNVDYLSAVRGVWYVLFQGPTVYNLRVGVQILLGLPFAEEAGVITEIREDFSDNQGRILVTDARNAAVVRSYTYPRGLALETNPVSGKPYVVGDTVDMFAPMVQGVEVLDYVNSPKWYVGYMEQGAFFEVEKFFRFLVRVDSAAFSLSSLLYVRALLERVRPADVFPMLVVGARIKRTTVGVIDRQKFNAKLRLFDLGVTDNAYGQATMFDEPDPSPTAPATPSPVVIPFGTTNGPISQVPAGGMQIGEAVSFKFDGEISSLNFDITGAPGIGLADYLIVIKYNGEQATSFTLTAPAMTVPWPSTLNVQANKEVTFWLVPSPAGARFPAISSIDIAGAYTFTPDPTSFGHGASQYDADADPNVGAPAPGDNQAVRWGFDKSLLLPRSTIAGIVRYVVSAPITPAYDTILQYDSAVFNATTAIFSDSWITRVLQAAPRLLRPLGLTASATMVADTVELCMLAGFAGPVSGYDIVVSINGVDQAPIHFDLVSGELREYKLYTTVSWNITAGDLITARMEAPSPIAQPWIQRMTLCIGTAVSWTMDGTLAPATYVKARPM